MHAKSSIAGAVVAVVCAYAVHAAQDTWAFLPQKDTFSSEALFDLRSLNETEAGAHGFITVSPEGDFLRGDGQPIRFWAVNTGVQFAQGKSLAHHARFLAKRGVNMVRFHNFMPPKGESSKLTDFNTGVRDACWRLVAAMKKEGIYTTISPYWANTVTVRAPWGVPGPAGQDAHALLFFDPTLQEGYKAWLRALYAEVNTHTGIPLAEDPAVAIIQLQNEDSLLFWTTDNMSDVQRKALGTRFGEWLVEKYGSLEKAYAAWNKADHDDDDFGRGVAGLYTIWEFTQPREKETTQRMADQLEFYGRTMHTFNTEMARYLREELGCRHLINAGNWKTADAILLDDIERWSYTANEVLAVNRYYSGVHLGPQRGWAINQGDKFTEQSIMQAPRNLPVNLKQVVGHPMLITESSWVPPLGYQSEGPFLVSAYSSLSGVDAYYWFATGEEEWWQPQSANGYTPGIGKWVFATPELLGSFPAAALMFRKGYIARGEPVVVEARPLKAMWHGYPPVIAEDPGYDPNRDLGDAAKMSNLKGGVHPFAFLIGPVMVEYSGHPTNTVVRDLKPYVDTKRKLVKSVTGELVMDCAHAVCILNAPKAQGISGFVGRVGACKLQDVVIECTNEYATVTTVALDDRPLGESRQVLIQVATRSRPSGWRVYASTIKTGNEDEGRPGFEIMDVGRTPWRVHKNYTTVEVTNPGLTNAAALDMNGLAVARLPVHATNGSVRVQVPEDTMYVVLQSARVPGLAGEAATP